MKPELKYTWTIEKHEVRGVVTVMRVNVARPEERDFIRTFKGKTALKRANLLVHNLRMENIKELNREIVRGGICPDCGAKLKANLALTGWIQCSNFGAVGFRADASKPSCNFQCFT